MIHSPRILFLLKFIFAQFIITSTICYASGDDRNDKPTLLSTSNSKANWPSPVMDTEHFGLLLFDLLEYSSVGSKGSLDWDIVGWRGSDTNRLWVKSEGSLAQSPSRSSSSADLQLLYGKLVTAFFDAQIGARLEQAWGNRQNASRVSAVLGLEGLSLYMFEFEAAIFASDAGQIAARISASEDFLLTQRAIMQLRLESSGTAKRSDEFETGSGLNDFSLGLRFRYEFKREVAPYIGVSWNNFYGETADFRKRSGGELSEVTAVSGLRIWY
ncbi:MAG: hypothetical protein B7Y39_04450 [Bdellovibrio sp. 28-41-41]|nr:MAG: hypothetical protein B7Y39_04450 [Bdellovibrio sp. 28-41-41]